MAEKMWSQKFMLTGENFEKVVVAKAQGINSRSLIMDGFRKIEKEPGCIAKVDGVIMQACSVSYPEMADIKVFLSDYNGENNTFKLNDIINVAISMADLDYLVANKPVKERKAYEKLTEEEKAARREAKKQARLEAKAESDRLKAEILTKYGLTK